MKNYIQPMRASGTYEKAPSRASVEGAQLSVTVGPGKAGGSSFTAAILVPYCQRHRNLGAFLWTVVAEVATDLTRLRRLQGDISLAFRTG